MASAFVEIASGSMGLLPSRNAINIAIMMSQKFAAAFGEIVSTALIKNQVLLTFKINLNL